MEDGDFESLVFGQDETMKRRCKREWISDARVKIKRKRARKEEAPFHSPEASFDAVLGAVEAVTNTHSDEVDERTAPVLTFKWVKDTLETFKHRQRDIGGKHERDATATRLPREHAGEALKLLRQLNELLESSANVDLQ